MNGRTIDLTTFDPASTLAQRVWSKVNQVYDWEVTASNQYSRFNVDVFYPASTYAGLATSRAAIGRMLIISGHGSRDDVLFHEFGHEVYYRRMYGESTYNSIYRQSIQPFQTGQFPLCANCLGHSLYKESGPDAAMLEGWADFFEALTVRVLPNVNTQTAFVWNIENLWSGADKGPNVEGRVAAFLWDLWDTPTSGSTDGDPVSRSGSDMQRYSRIANYFANADVLSSFRWIWHNRIKSTLSAQEFRDHCFVLRMNTLNGTPGITDVDSSCP